MGYNEKLFAYEQTRSGKSWSVIGYGANKCMEWVALLVKVISYEACYWLYFSLPRGLQLHTICLRPLTYQVGQELVCDWLWSHQRYETNKNGDGSLLTSVIVKLKVMGSRYLFHMILSHNEFTDYNSLVISKVWLALLFNLTLQPQ